MFIYVPAHFEKHDYRPSWTGNNWYPTVTIRGIFDSEEKAIKAIGNWQYKDDYSMESREIEGDAESFDIVYDGYLTIWESDDGEYNLNKTVDEDFSAVYDKHGWLGVSDY
jgi:hypothetical protein